MRQVVNGQNLLGVWVELTNQFSANAGTRTCDDDLCVLEAIHDWAGG